MTLRREPQWLSSGWEGFGKLPRHERENIGDDPFAFRCTVATSAPRKFRARFATRGLKKAAERGDAWWQLY